VFALSVHSRLRTLGVVDKSAASGFLIAASALCERRNDRFCAATACAATRDTACGWSFVMRCRVFGCESHERICGSCRH
jgi:hypothetical protein